MKAILVTVGSFGDVHPFISIGQGLVSRGHEVWLLTSGHFETVVRKAGLNFFALGTREEYQEFLGLVDFSKPFEMGQLLAEALMIRPMIPTYQWIESESGQDTVIFGHVGALGCRLAREKLGIPLLSLVLSPASVRSTIRPPRLGPFTYPTWIPQLGLSIVDYLIVWLLDSLLKPQINPVRTQLNLPPISRVADWIYSPDMNLGLFPDWFAPKQSDWPRPFELSGFPFFDQAEGSEIPEGVQGFLKQGSPPILFTQGTPSLQARSFFQSAVESCKHLSKRGILISQDPLSQFPSDLPETVIGLKYLAFSEVLPFCSLCVHHGGIGTSAQALKAGVPQLVVPWGVDQWDNAQRLKDLGVAKELRDSKHLQMDMINKIEEITRSNEIKESCLQAKFRFNGSNPVEDICKAGESLL